MTLVDNSNPFDDVYVAPEPYGKTMSCSTKLCGLFSTAFGFIGAMVVMLIEKQDQYIRLTAIHSFLCHIVVDVLLFIFALIMIADHVFCYILFGIYAVFWVLFYAFLIIMAICRTESGDAFMFPGVDKLVMYLESKI